MRLGIDASNLRSGGTQAHLVQLLSAADPAKFGFDRVVVWASRHTVEQLPKRLWLEAIHETLLDGSLSSRLYWQMSRLSGLARRNCDLLFVPGGNYLGSFRPVVTMSQNLLPFQPEEWRRYGVSLQALRLRLLRWGHSSAFRRSQGVIFLSEYSRQHILKQVHALRGETAVIPHGIEPRFYCAPRPAKPLSAYSMAQPLKLLYVSTLDMYKHQENIAEAVAESRQRGVPLSLDLVGDAYGPALRQLRQTLGRVDRDSSFVHYDGPKAFSAMPEIYREADIFVFASTCESLPNILLEAMASGLPICCSDRGVMPSVLGTAGVYFDPEKPSEIAAAIERMAGDAALRAKSSQEAYSRAQEYTWKRCAEQTFTFLARQGKKSG